MVETPGGRRSTRRKSQFPQIDGASEDGDSSSAAETTATANTATKRRTSRKTTAKRMESLEQSDATSEAESFSPVANEKLAAVIKDEEK